MLQQKLSTQAILHCELRVQVAGDACAATQIVPLHQKPLRQLMSPVASFDGQLVLHTNPFVLQLKLLAHVDDAPAGLQVPEPLHNGAGVKVLPLHIEAPQVVVFNGNMHAPPEGLQSVAPQGAAVGEQEETQQCPLPAIPQTPLKH
jgi:hypothetical protein